MLASHQVQHWGSRGSGRAQFHLPHAVAILPRGTSYEVMVADRGNGRVGFFRSDGTWLDSLHFPQGTKALGVSAAGPGKFAVALRSAAGYGQVWHGTDRVWRPSYFGEWGVNMTNHSEARARDAAQSSIVLVSEAQFTNGIARWASGTNAAGSFIVQGASQQAAKASMSLTATPAETLREPYALSVAARAVGARQCAYITEATAGVAQGRLWCSCNLHG